MSQLVGIEEDVKAQIAQEGKETAAHVDEKISVLSKKMDGLEDMKSQVSMRSYIWCIYVLLGFPGGSVVKKLPTKAGDAKDSGLIPGLGRSPGEGNGNPPQYSCLGNPMDRRAWRATVHEVSKESDTT